MNEKIKKRNYLLGVLNGIFVRVYYSTLHGDTILPAFLSNLTSSNILIGVAVALRKAGEVLPQMAVAHRIENQPQKKPLYVAMAWVRTLTLALLLAAIWWLVPVRPELLLPLFFIIFPIHTIATGIAQIPFTDIVGKITPKFRRGGFFSARYFYGGILAALAGFFIVKPVLNRYPFPRSYAIIFFFSFIFLVLALFVFSFIKEPIHPVREERRPFFRYLKSGLNTLKTNRNYSLLIILEFVQGFGIMAGPFYVIFARKELGIPEAMVGIFLAASQVGYIVTTLPWGKLSMARGSKPVISLAAAVAILPPLIALLSSRGYFSAPVFFIILFFLSGVRMSGHGIGRMSYLLDISPPVERPAYIAFNRTLTLPVLFFPVLAGVIINISSFEFLFAATLIVGILAFVLSLGLQGRKL